MILSNKITKVNKKEKQTLQNARFSLIFKVFKYINYCILFIQFTSNFNKALNYYFYFKLFSSDCNSRAIILPFSMVNLSHGNLKSKSVQVIMV